MDVALTSDFHRAQHHAFQPRHVHHEDSDQFPHLSWVSANTTCASARLMVCSRATHPEGTENNHRERA